MYYIEGILKAIGLRDFDKKSLLRLMESTKVKPSVLQINLNIFQLQKQLDDKGNILMII